MVASRTLLEPREVIEARDIRLLQLLADGEEFRTIAVTFGITYDSLKQRSYRLYQRLGADNMTHAVALAFRRGLIQ